MGKTYLTFEGYEVTKMSFEKTNDLEKGIEYRINHNINVSIANENDNVYLVKLEFNLLSVDEKPLPFKINVEVVGRFKLTIDEDENDFDKLKQILLNQNAPAILFPYLRSIVSNLTLNANISPLILPTVNFTNSEDE